MGRKRAGISGNDETVFELYLERMLRILGRTNRNTRRAKVPYQLFMRAAVVGNETLLRRLATKNN